MSKFKVGQIVTLKPWDEIKDLPAFKDLNHYSETVEKFIKENKEITINFVYNGTDYNQAEHGIAYRTKPQPGTYILHEDMLIDKQASLSIDDILIGIMDNSTKKCEELLSARQEEINKNMLRNRVLRTEIKSIKDYL